MPLLLVIGCAARAPSASPLRVLTYNIHAGTDAARQPNLDRVAGVIRDAAADIVLLQEVDRGTRRSGGADQLALLARLTGLHGAFGKSLDYDGGEYGIAMLSRFPLESVRVVPLQVHPAQERAGGAYEPRVALHAIARTPRGAVHVLNTHLDPGADPAYRHQEVIGLLAHLARAVPASAVLIVGGDLNARPDTPEMQALGLAMIDAWTRCGDDRNGHSFPARQPDRRIDYIWMRHAGCTSARVLETQASDHRPVLVIIGSARRD